MLGQVTLDRYLEDVQRLSQQIASGEKDLTDLQAMLDVALEESQDDPTRQAFFLGERAFYQRQYKLALKHYMDARELPMFQFFCYRTCAFLFDLEQKIEKALDFAAKALALIPNDWTTVALYSALLGSLGRHDEAHVWRSKLQEPPAPLHETHSTDDGETSASVSLGAAEFDELSQLFQEHAESISTNISPSLPAPKLFGEDSRGTEISRGTASEEEELFLSRRLHAFQESQKKALKEYLVHASQKIAHQDYLFHVLDGWTEPMPESTSLPLLLNQKPLHTSGGYFLKWHGKGIAINPGGHFLQTLHRQGFHIQDIDFVIVTKNTPASFADVKAIYDLNGLVNGSQEDIHVIRYYLNQPAYQLLARVLKPHFKQERHSVHCLDLYLDSSDLETVSLTDHVLLNYFPTSSLSRETSKTDDSLQPAIGIRLDLTGPAQAGLSGHPVKVAYVSGAPWSPLLAEHLVGCDLLITGIEETSPEDWRRTQYNQQSLGYFGSLSLLEEIQPRLMLACEFSGHGGDMRIELVRKLRTDYAIQNSRSTTILPGDAGLSIDLTTLQIRCAASHSFVDPSLVHVVRGDNQFGALNYLAPQCLI